MDGQPVTDSAANILSVECGARGPAVEQPIKPGAEQEDQVAEEIAGEEKGGSGFCAGELPITFS